MESPAWMFTKALNHRQKVCRLFKRALREADSWYGGDILEVRYQKVVLRARFDAASDEKDPRKASIMLADGCKELWSKKHPKTFRFALDPNGSAFDRDRESPDEILDWSSYTLAEREQFPRYFNMREQRKKEILDQWFKIEKSWDEELSKIQTELPKEKAAAASSVN